MIERGDIWWAELADPRGSAPGGRRPVLVIQAQAFNRSRIRTVVVAVVTSNLALGQAPGNVTLAAGESGLPRDSVVNVSQIVTLDRALLTEKAGELAGARLEEVSQGLRRVLSL